jgi:hypothetical protein
VIVIVSPAFRAPTKAKHMESVQAQKGATYRHLYIEASEQSPVKGSCQNVDEAVRPLAPDDIVVCLDGDDWFAHDRVLARVAEMYSDPSVWLTYGSFSHSDGNDRRFGASPVKWPPRKTDWTATHLKTFRAALYQHIKLEDLKPRGEWWDYTADQAMMLPMLEMAGPAHSRFCPEVLYTYYHHPRPHDRARYEACERERVARIRVRPPYSPLESL